MYVFSKGMLLGILLHIHTSLGWLRNRVARLRIGINITAREVSVSNTANANCATESRNAVNRHMSWPQYAAQAAGKFWSLNY